MKATETTLQSIIEGGKQYLVPLFQRPYSWGPKQWQVLWEDLMEVCEAGNPRTHFIGSIVTMQTVSVPEGVPKYLLIDGQQRLTTIFILLTVVRDIARQSGSPELAQEIEMTLLMNPFAKGDNRYKLMPTQDNRESFRRLIFSDGPTPDDLIGKAYKYFDKKMKQSGGVEINTVKESITARLSVVSIVLDKDDNPYLVFESLNAKGEPLTQADLIRNFFFLRIHSDQQEEMHSKYWKPMEDVFQVKDDPDKENLAGKNLLTEFIRHYLTGDGLTVRADSVYFTLKERLGQGDALNLLSELSRAAIHYKKLLTPSTEPDAKLRDGLARLKRLEVTTSYPFLLRCYREHEAGTLLVGDFRQIVACIENYIIRRFVCGVPTNQLNKIFSPLFNQILAGGHASLLEGVKRTLSGKGYPKDAEFRSRLTDAKLYGQGDRQSKTKFILECIDRSYGHKEVVEYPNLNIEHIMPQTLSESWQADLGIQGEVIHELLLHTIGNLTLTAYNPELSNSEFSKKKELLAQSHLEINKYFEPLQSWGEEEIEARAILLAEIAISVWPNFGDDKPEPASTLSAGKPKGLLFLGREFEVGSWRDVLETTINQIEANDPEQFDAIMKALPRLVGSNPENYISSRQLKNGLFISTHFSAKETNRYCLRALDVAGIDHGTWSVKLDLGAVTGPTS